jgi:hypothetical protein
MPVHQPLGAVDQALLVERDEHFADSLAEALVHGEALARPVGGGAETLQLVEDGTAGLGLPLPYALEEFLTAHVAAARLLPLGELALDDHLRGDAGVIGAGLPQHILAAHALEADQDVLDGVVERVPDMQRARDVGWRDDDREGLGAGLGPCAGLERSGLLPLLVDAGLDSGRFVVLLKHRWFPTATTHHDAPSGGGRARNSTASAKAKAGGASQHADVVNKAD